MKPRTKVEATLGGGYQLVIDQVSFQLTERDLLRLAQQVHQRLLALAKREAP